jgi:hypothetical protein
MLARKDPEENPLSTVVHCPLKSCTLLQHTRSALEVRNQATPLAPNTLWDTRVSKSSLATVGHPPIVSNRSPYLADAHCGNVEEETKRIGQVSTVARKTSQGLETAAIIGVGGINSKWLVWVWVKGKVSNMIR